MRLDAVLIDVAQVARDRHPVHDVERVVARRDGARSADADVLRRAGVEARGGDVDAGDSPLDGVEGVAADDLLEHLRQP